MCDCGATMPTRFSSPSLISSVHSVVDIVVDVLRRQEGNVLIPVETVGRVFELLLALDARLASLPYPVVFLSNLSSKTIEFIRVGVLVRLRLCVCVCVRV